MKKQGNNSNLVTIILVVLILAAAVGAGVFFATRNRNKTITQNSQASEDVETTETIDYRNIIYNGTEYEYNTNLNTLLFLGVDTRESAQTVKSPGFAGQSDCIIVLIMDTETKKTKMLEIPRESMVAVDIYDSNGTLSTTEKAQITLQYGYGDGGSKSNWLMKNAVSELLYQIPIDECLALNIDGITSITDALGGVELTVPEDYTVIDPAFVQGSTITLNGAQAERYVRYRDTSVTGSNMDRMKRQNQFIPALLSKAKTMTSGSADMYNTLYNAASPYMNTDLSADSLKSLASYDLEDEPEIVPGEITAGAEHDEYLVDYDKLKELVIKLFYKEK